MRGYIKVNLLLLERKSFALVLIPQMTVGEITQLVLAGKMLHNPSTPNLQTIPLGLISSRNHIVMDYLLTQCNITLDEVWQTQRYIEGEIITKKARHMPKDFSLHIDNKVSKEIDAKVFYEPSKKSVSKRSVLQNLQCTLLMNQEEGLPDGNQTCVRTVTIMLNTKSFLFQQIQKIQKKEITSYSHMQKLLSIRQKLLKHRLHHVDIFGQLVQLKQSKDSFDFFFNYLPSIPVSSIVHLGLSPLQRQNLINKLWLFISNMRNNNFEQYISNLLNKKELKQLLNAIDYNINAGFKLNDYTMILSESISSQTKLSPEDERELLKQIYDYVNKAYRQYERAHQIADSYDQSQDSSTIISKRLFIQIFELKYCQNWNSMAGEEFTPVSIFFNWQIQSKTMMKWKQAKSFHEASTVKKAVKINQSSSKKTKKNVRSTSVKTKIQPSMSHKARASKVRYVHMD